MAGPVISRCLFSICSCFRTLLTASAKKWRLMQFCHKIFLPMDNHVLLFLQSTQHGVFCTSWRQSKRSCCCDCDYFWAFSNLQSVRVCWPQNVLSRFIRPLLALLEVLKTKNLSLSIFGRLMMFKTIALLKRLCLLLGFSSLTIALFALFHLFRWHWFI